jgi:hypothetical protein
VGAAGGLTGGFDGSEGVIEAVTLMFWLVEDPLSLHWAETVSTISTLPEVAEV